MGRVDWRSRNSSVESFDPFDVAVDDTWQHSMPPGATIKGLSKHFSTKQSDKLLNHHNDALEQMLATLRSAWLTRHINKTFRFFPQKTDRSLISFSHTLSVRAAMFVIKKSWREPKHNESERPHQTFLSQKWSHVCKSKSSLSLIDVRSISVSNARAAL